MITMTATTTYIFPLLRIKSVGSSLLVIAPAFCCAVATNIYNEESNERKKYLSLFIFQFIFLDGAIPDAQCCYPGS